MCFQGNEEECSQATRRVLLFSELEEEMFFCDGQVLRDRLKRLFVVEANSKWRCSEIAALHFYPT